ncbi:MAG: phosphoribosylformylglycinamidine cyclo-ligase [Thermoplasmata archaeon]
MKTYSEAGVNIDKKSIFLDLMLSQIKFHRGRNINLKGHYTGLVDFGDYYFALNTDGVGTKMIIAEELKKFDTVGIDCVAMNVNDTICVGAEPLAMVDYLVINRYEDWIAEQIGTGLNKGLELANTELVGGETAVMPDLVNNIDLSGTALGLVKKDKLVSGSAISDGDLIIGLESSGLHSNGFTLVRRLIKENNISYNDKIGNAKLGNLLLEPTKIYVKEILELLKISEIHGIAHITGGGLRNLIRLKKKRFILDNLIEPAPIFQFIQKLGGVSDFEMYQTFNMGMGFAIIIPERDADTVLQYLKHKIDAQIVGFVAPGENVFVPELKISYEKY